MNEKTSGPRLFVVDNMLGKVAKWLRVLGFDTLYTRLERQEQVDRYQRAGRIIISRNRRWCGRKQVFCVTANDPMEQLREVVRAVPLLPGEVRLFHRCTLCNEALEMVDRDEAIGQVPDYVIETNPVFCRCPKCRRFYWPGTHPKRMMKRLHDVLGWLL